MVAESSTAELPFFLPPVRSPAHAIYVPVVEVDAWWWLWILLGVLGLFLLINAILLAIYCWRKKHGSRTHNASASQGDSLSLQGHKYMRQQTIV